MDIWGQIKNIWKAYDVNCFVKLYSHVDVLIKQRIMGFFQMGSYSWITS